MQLRNISSQQMAVAISMIVKGGFSNGSCLCVLLE
jgi:hypothetical protein